MNEAEQYGVRTVILATTLAIAVTIVGPFAWAWIYPNHAEQDVLSGFMIAGFAVAALTMFTRFTAFDAREKTNG